MDTCPPVTGSSPAMTINNDVFPDPEGPTIPTVSPAKMERSMPRSTSTTPALDVNDRLTFESQLPLQGLDCYP